MNNTVKMKPYIYALITILFFSCKSEPEETFKKYINAINTGNYEEAKKYCIYCEDKLKIYEHTSAKLDVKIYRLDYNESKDICKLTILNHHRDTFYHYMVLKNDEWRLDLSKGQIR